MKLSAKEAAEVYAARNKHKGDVMERREQDECAFVHRLVSGNVRCGALREHHSQHTGHKFTEPKRQPVTRFRISTHESGYYCVSIPNYKGGEVVIASEHAALVEQRDLLVKALTKIRTWLVSPATDAVTILEMKEVVNNALAAVEQGEGREKRE